LQIALLARAPAVLSADVQHPVSGEMYAMCAIPPNDAGWLSRLVSVVQQGANSTNVNFSN
jgi:hypothetical protein